MSTRTSSSETSPVAPYDALLLFSFGGPDGPDDVLPFLRNVTAGKGIPDERLAVVAEHYHHFGGASPINGQNLALQKALADELARRGLDLPVRVGQPQLGAVHPRRPRGGPRRRRPAHASRS